MVYSIDDGIIVEIFKNIYLIRSVEEMIAKKYPEGKMRCPVHLSVGQEAIPAALSQVISRDDFAVSGHRGHAHYLSKGGNLKAMIAEIYGKSDGCAKGKGGSMHIADFSKGMLGANAIVGANAPIAVGAALRQRVMGENLVSAAFIGDGASNQGAVFEAMNLASVLKLPVLFVFENNGYAEFSSSNEFWSAHDK